jgi:fucose permease
MAIIGGALLPVLFASVADMSGISDAFFVPMCAYAAIGVFGVSVAGAAVKRLTGVPAH